MNKIRIDLQGTKSIKSSTEIKKQFTQLEIYAIQLKLDQTAWLLSKPNVDEVILRRLNLSLKCCQPLEHLTYFKWGTRSFHRDYMASAGQSAAKLPSFKL